MSTDEFTKLFKYMEDRFDRIEQRLDGTADKGDVDRLFAAFDSLAKQQEISDEERLVMSHQLDRLNDWASRLADKTGVTLTA